MEIENKMMQLNWKFKILSAILIGLLFVTIMYMVDYFLIGEVQRLNSYLFQGIFFGVVMGFGFPYAMQKFGTKYTSTLGKHIQPELTPYENIETEGAANLFCGIEAVGGKLFLTNKKVVFKSHQLNIQKAQRNIPYEDILEISKRNTAKLIGNGIRIKTTDGNVFDFVVNQREKWLEKLNEKI